MCGQHTSIYWSVNALSRFTINSNKFCLNKSCGPASRAAFSQGVLSGHQNDSQPGRPWGHVSVEKACSTYLLFLFCKAQGVKVGVQAHVDGGRRRRNKEPAFKRMRKTFPDSQCIDCWESESEGVFLSAL